jgi:hypothetical protein
MSELPKGFVSASHTVLFQSGEDRCSVCSDELGPEDEGGEEAVGLRPNHPDWMSDIARLSSSVRGRGLLVWARGEERRYEEPHLCPSCASAIGVSALQRWEIEEDEGRSPSLQPDLDPFVERSRRSALEMFVAERTQGRRHRG